MNAKMLLLSLAPGFIQQMVLNKIVKRGYAVNTYNAKYRTTQRQLTDNEKAALHQLFKQIPQRSKILDIGCGNGELWDKYFVANGHRVTGIDISQRQIAHAATAVPEGHFMVGDFMTCKIGERFDAITAFYATYHIPANKLHKFYRKMYRLLRPGGVMLQLVRVEATKGIDYWDEWCDAPMAFTYPNSAKLRNIASSEGFSTFRYKHENPEYVWLFLRKPVPSETHVPGIGR